MPWRNFVSIVEQLFPARSAGDAVIALNQPPRLLNLPFRIHKRHSP
jgi:hypothetical protein